MIRQLRAATLVAMISAAATAPLAAQAKSDLMWKNLESSVTRITSSFDGVMSVTIRDLTDGRTFSVLGDEVMPTASMIKIAVLTELYRQKRLGEMYTLDAKDVVPGSLILSRFTPGLTRLTLRDVATSMIGESDNTATNVLIDRLGMDKVNAMLTGLGQTRTKLQRKMMDLAAAQAGRENIASATETVDLLTKLYKGQILPADQTADFFKVLATQKKSRILALLPAGAKGATKTGTLDGVVTEAGVLYVDRRPFVIAIMSTFVQEPDSAERAIGEISRLAWNHFARLGGSSEFGRGLPSR